jgi:hypothetical protein
MAFASVEVAGPLDVAITIRDHNGWLLYSVDPAILTTVIAKQMKRPGRSLPVELAPEPDNSLPGEMPEECEGAFSAYASPRMAHIIEQCISAIAGNVQVALAFLGPFAGYDQGKTFPQRKTLGTYLTNIARLGGYLARANDPSPGNMVMWRGLSRLTDIELGAVVGVQIVGN